MTDQEKERILKIAEELACDIDGDILFDPKTKKKYYVNLYCNLVIEVLQFDY